MSPRIGDTLISMVVANNLVRHGIDVTVFSRHLHAMRKWFPGFRIEPELHAAQARNRLEHFDVMLHAYESDVLDDARDWHPRVWVMDRWATYRQVKPMVDIQLDLCRHCFGLDGLTRDNGLVVPVDVGVTAVSLAMRPRIAVRWAPGWALSLAVTAPPLMPGRWLREHSWKYLLSVRKVDAAVERLRRRVSEAVLAFDQGPAGERMTNKSMINANPIAQAPMTKSRA